MLWESLLGGLGAIIAAVTFAVTVGWVVILWSTRNID